VKPAIPGRLRAQGLDAPRFASAPEVVRHLCCVQSQLYDMALWAVARRTHGATLVEVDASFRRGEFLRTHVLRPTWHFVDPADIHWLLALTAPRVRRLMASGNRVIGLTEARLDQAAEVIAAALVDGTPRTRSELAEMLSAAGLEHTGQALAHAVMHAETHALIANGPMRGKQHTYVLLPESPPTPPYGSLLAEAARRYARGHGPFRDKDLAWWTSLTLTDSRRAIELADLRPLDIDGTAYWTDGELTESEVPRAMLLSNFDEYISFARDPEDYAGFAGTVNDVMRGSGLLMLDGRLAGTWNRAIKAAKVEIEVAPSPVLTAAMRRALEEESAAFGRFVGRHPELRIVS
jgi:hypothetical protein